MEKKYVLDTPSKYPINTHTWKKRCTTENKWRMELNRNKRMKWAQEWNPNHTHKKTDGLRCCTICIHSVVHVTMTVPVLAPVLTATTTDNTEREPRREMNTENNRHIIFVSFAYLVMFEWYNNDWMRSSWEIESPKPKRKKEWTTDQTEKRMIATIQT